MRRCLAITLAAAVLTTQASPHRSRAAVDHFRSAHPCPATGSTHGRCPGYVVDHVRPLCAHGADAPSNMQWQELAASKRKDADERRECRALHR